MAVNPTYPGVYVEEIPSGVHTLVGVATSITAFLGRSARGPVNSARTLLSFADFERTFGPLDPEYPLGYAVRDFFDYGGSEAIVVRIFSDAGVTAAQATAAAAVASNDNDPAVVAQAAATKAATYDTEPAKSKAAAVATAATNASTGNNATSQKVKDAANAAAAGITDSSTANTKPNDFLQLAAVGPGPWGNDLYIAMDTSGITQQVADRFNIDQNLLFNLSVYYNGNKLDTDKLKARPPDERFLSVSLWDGAGSRRLDRVLKSESNLVRFAGKTSPTKADVTAAVVTADNGAQADPQEKKPHLIAFGGGFDSLPILNNSAVYLGSESEKTGLHALDDVSLVNLLCIPADARGEDTDPDVYSAAMRYCVSRRALLIVDPPKAWANRVNLISDPETRFNELGLNGIEARNAFIYYPRVQMSDPMRAGQRDTFPACGIIAGIFARTDTQRGVWVAPAGLDAGLGNVTLEVNLTDRENGVLNPLGINCLRSFRVGGPVVWGSRTARGADQLADEYKYLPVRRTALYIEESLYRGTQWIVFKPNDEPLWGQIRLSIGAFMNDLFRKGAFQGSRPQDAYFVRCDSTTTTQTDIDRGIVNVIVGFAPLKPAEFVIIQVQQIAGQIPV